MSRRRYAEGTEVSEDRSRAEIERLVDRYGATSFAYMRTQEGAAVGFAIRPDPEGPAWRVQFQISRPLPGEFAETEGGRARSPTQVARAVEQESRRRWRALALAVKAKLEVVETGIATFEEEFLAHIVAPDGRPFAETAVPALTAAYETGELPELMPRLLTDGRS